MLFEYNNKKYFVFCILLELDNYLVRIDEDYFTIDIEKSKPRLTEITTTELIKKINSGYLALQTYVLGNKLIEELKVEHIEGSLKDVVARFNKLLEEYKEVYLEVKPTRCKYTFLFYTLTEETEEDVLKRILKEDYPIKYNIEYYSKVKKELKYVQF